MLLSSLPLTGGVSVEGGATLAVSNGADLTALLGDTANVTYQAGSFLGVDTSGGDISSSADIGSSYPSAGLEKLGPGTLTLTGTNSYSGATTVSAGILEASPLSSLPLTGEVTVHADPTFAVSSVGDLAALLGDSANVAYEPGSYLGVDTTGGDISSSADIGSAYPNAGLGKLGPGTLSLTNAQTYGGSTTVSGGVLALTPTWTVIPGTGMEGTEVVEFNDTGQDQNSAAISGFLLMGRPHCPVCHRNFRHDRSRARALPAVAHRAAARSGRWSSRSRQRCLVRDASRADAGNESVARRCRVESNSRPPIGANYCSHAAGWPPRLRLLIWGATRRGWGCRTR